MNLCGDQLVLQLADRSRIAAITSSSLVPDISTVVDLAQGMNTIKGTLEEVLVLDPDLVITGRYDSQKINILKKLIKFKVKLSQILDSFSIFIIKNLISLRLIPS